MNGRARRAAAQFLDHCGTRPSRDAIEDLAERQGTEGEELLLELGRRGAEEARQPLLRLLREVREPEEAARVAEVLVAGYGDDSGLRAFQGDLAAFDAGAFGRALRIYQLLAPARRDEEYVARVGRALERQTKAEHVAALLELLRGVKPSEAVGELVVPWLQDKRRTRGTLLGRRARLGDLAAERLLEALGIERGRSLAARLRFRRCRRRLLRELQTIEDWRRLLAGEGVRS